MVIDLVSALSVEPNEFLLSLYSCCPFHLNLLPNPIYQSLQFRVLCAKLFVFLQASLNADSGKRWSCQKQTPQARNNRAWWMGRASFLLPPAVSAVLGAQHAWGVFLEALLAYVFKGREVREMDRQSGGLNYIPTLSQLVRWAWARWLISLSCSYFQLHIGISIPSSSKLKLGGEYDIIGEW